MSAGPAGCDAWRVARAERATAAKYPSIQLSKERKIRRKVYIHSCRQNSDRRPEISFKLSHHFVRVHICRINELHIHEYS